MINDDFWTSIGAEDYAGSATTPNTQNSNDFWSSIGAEDYVGSGVPAQNKASITKQNNPAPSVEKPIPTPQQLSNPISKKSLSKPLGSGQTEMRSGKRNILNDLKYALNNPYEAMANSARAYLNVPKFINPNLNFGDKLLGTQKDQDILSKRKMFQPMFKESPKYYVGDSTAKISEDLKTGKINTTVAQQRAKDLRDVEQAIAEKEYIDRRNANVAYGTSILATTPLSVSGSIANAGRAIAPNVIKEVVKNLATKEGLAKGAINLGKHIGTGAIEGGTFGALDYGLKEGFGIENEGTLGDAVAQGAGAGSLFGTAFGSAPIVRNAIGKVSKGVANSKVGQQIANSKLGEISNAITNNQRVQNVIAGMSRALGTDISKLPENIRKTRELDEALVALYDNKDRYTDVEFNKRLADIVGTKFNVDEARLLEQALKQGIGVDDSVLKNAKAMNDFVAPTKAEPTTTTPNEDVVNSVKAMNDLVAPKQPEPAEASTRPVKNETDINTPKEDLTHVNEAPSELKVEEPETKRVEKTNLDEFKEDFNKSNEVQKPTPEKVNSEPIIEPAVIKTDDQGIPISKIKKNIRRLNDEIATRRRIQELKKPADRDWSEVERLTALRRELKESLKQDKRYTEAQKQQDEINENWESYKSENEFNEADTYSEQSVWKKDAETDLNDLSVREESKTTQYSSSDPRVTTFVDNFFKASTKKKKQLLANKFRNASADEAKNIYQNLLTESERLTNQGKAKRVGEIDLRTSKQEASDLKLIQDAYEKYADKTVNRLTDAQKWGAEQAVRDAFSTAKYKPSKKMDATMIAHSRFISDWENAQNAYNKAFDRISNSNMKDRTKIKALELVNDAVEKFNSDPKHADFTIKTKKLVTQAQKKARALSNLEEANIAFDDAVDATEIAKSDIQGYNAIKNLKYASGEQVKNAKDAHYSRTLLVAETKVKELDEKIAKLEKEYNDTKLSRKKEDILIKIENLKKEKANIAKQTERMVKKQFTDTSKTEMTSYNENFGKKSQGIGKLNEQKYEGTGMSWDSHSEGIDQPVLKAEQAKWEKHKLDKDIEATNQMVDEDGLLDVPRIKAYIDDLRDTKKWEKVFKDFKKEYMHKNGISSQKFTKEFGTVKEYVARFSKRADRIESRYATPLGVKPKQTLEYKDIDSISSAVEDATKTRFAKANRGSESHKISDYIDEIAKEDKEVQKLIKDNFGDNDLFNFADNFAEGSHGRVDIDTNAITINSKDPIQRQLETIKHETHHILTKRIAEACGKDSVEYRIYSEGVKANERIHTFEANNKDIVSIDNKLVGLLKSKKFSEADKFVDSISDKEFSKLMEYKELKKQYWNCDLEVSARNASKGEWKFYGKDAKDYERILRVYRKRTDRVGQKRSTEVRGSLQRTTRGRTGDVQKRVRQKDDSVHGDVQRPDDRYSTERTILDDKDWGEYKAVKKAIEDFKTSNAPRTKKLRQTYRQIEASSKASEALKVELGIVTKEEAQKRLKMQHKDGKGVYYRKIVKGEEDIDLLRDYNEGRDSKVGIFGRKKSNRVDVSSPEDILLSAKREEIKVKHIKDAIDVLEKNFGKPIVDGRVLRDYIPVNKKLIASTMYSGNSKEWYNAISGGKNSILNAFEKEWSKLDEDVAKEQREYLEALYDRTKDYDFQIPKSVFDKLFSGKGETTKQFFSRYGVNATSLAKLAGNLLDYENAGFKRRVLVSGSFFINNRIGNQIMALAKSDNVVDYIKAIAKSGKIKEEDIPSEILEASILEAFKGYDRRVAYTGNVVVDNFLNMMHGHEIKTKNLTLGKKALATTGNVLIALPNKVYNKVAKKCMAFNEKFERLERKQLFAGQVEKVKKDLMKKTGRKAIATEEAIKYINEDPIVRATVVKNIEDILGDYNKFSRTERNVFKRVFPFYSWMRTISRHVYTGVKKHPERYALIALELHKLQEDDNRPIKEYQRGKFAKLPIKDSKGRQLGILKSQANPFGTFEDQADNPLGSMSPAITTSMEAIKGKKLFADMDFTDERYVRQFDKIFDTKTGKYLNSNITPLSVRAKYYGKQKALNTFAPFMDNQLLKLPERVGAIDNYRKTGEVKTYDKIYDTSFGGFNNKDLITYKDGDTTKVLRNKKGELITRYAGNDYDEWVKILNSLGAGITVERPLNKQEKKEYKAKILTKEQKVKKKRLNDKKKNK